MNIPVFSNKGTKAGDMTVSDVVFGASVKPSVIHAVYVALRANAREAWAHTKTRGEVRGGGRKPWRQKGTGRARHGSNRSPIWSGGGITFGPRNVRNYTQKINRKHNRTAIRMAISDKVAHERFIIVEDFVNEEGKTKVFAELRNALPGAGYSTVVVTAGKDDMVLRATNNIQKVDVARAEDLNVVDLMHHQYVLATKAAVEALDSRLGGSKK
jgi:large subunit ribosomal protein L4